MTLACFLSAGARIGMRNRLRVLEFAMNASIASACLPTRARIRIAICVAAMTCPLPSLCRAQSDASSRDDEGVRALAVEYLANRDSFQKLDCVYQLRSYRHPVEGDLFRDAAQVEATAKGVIARDGAKVREEMLVDDAVVEESLRRGWIVFAPCSRVLDGDRGVGYGKDLNVAVLYSAACARGKLVITPFDFGRFTGDSGQDHPGAIIEHPELKRDVRLLDREATPNQPQTAVETSKLVGIEYVSEVSKGHAMRWQFFLAPDAGYLPIVCRSYIDERPLQKAVITDVRRIGKSRAYPMRSVNFAYHENESQVKWANETRVISLKVDEPVDPARFRLELPKGAHLRDAADDKSQFEFPATRTVGLEDLDDLFAQTRERSKAVAEWEKTWSGPKPEASPAVGRNWGKSLLLWTNIAIVAALAVAIAVRRLRSRVAT